MHRTASVDYGIVLEGEITLILDDSDAYGVEMALQLERAGEQVGLLALIVGAPLSKAFGRGAA